MSVFCLLVNHCNVADIQAVAAWAKHEGLVVSEGGRWSYGFTVAMKLGHWDDITNIVVQQIWSGVSSDMQRELHLLLSFFRWSEILRVCKILDCRGNSPGGVVIK